MGDVGGFSLMDDGGGGLTKNQESILNARRGEIFAGENGWRIPLGFVGVMSLIGFVLGCVATDMARNNAAAIDAIDLHPGTLQCAYGDNTFGEEVVKGHEGGSHYQLVGAGNAALTWMQAYQDAKGRCFNGHQGYLAIVGNQDENDFLHDLIQSDASWSTGNDAWIGATDTSAEGTFAWVGPGKMSTGQLVFWDENGAVDGSFTNWGDNEPNEGGSSGVAEDCVAMYGGGEGKWYDKNCYYTQPFFIVEFGPPSADTEEVWEKEFKNDDTKLELDDDNFNKKKKV